MQTMKNRIRTPSICPECSAPLKVHDKSGHRRNAQSCPRCGVWLDAPRRSSAKPSDARGRYDPPDFDDSKEWEDELARHLRG